MNFSDEHYVRIYTRDTKTWLRWGWEGQCVFMHVMRKLDKSGVIDDIEEPVSDVSLITGLPEEVVSVGLPKVLKSGALEIVGGNLVAPKYLDAQTASKSDRQRSKERRERRRDLARSPVEVEARPSETDDEQGEPLSSTGDEGRVENDRTSEARDESVTIRDESDGDEQDSVGNDHLVQRSTTQSSARPPVVPQGTESEDPPSVTPGISKPKHVRNFEASFGGKPDPADEQAFAAWATKFSKTGARFDAKRAVCLETRRLEGMTPEDVAAALDGAAVDRWCKSTGYKLSCIFGNREQFEVFRDRGYEIQAGTFRPDGDSVGDSDRATDETGGYGRARDWA